MYHPLSLFGCLWPLRGCLYDSWSPQLVLCTCNGPQIGVKFSHFLKFYHLSTFMTCRWAAQRNAFCKSKPCDHYASPTVKSWITPGHTGVQGEILPFYQFFLFLKSTNSSIEVTFHVHKPGDQYTNCSLIKTSKHYIRYVVVSTNVGWKIFMLQKIREIFILKKNKSHHSTRHLSRSNPSFYCTL